MFTPPPLPSLIQRGWAAALDFCFPTLCPCCEKRESDSATMQLFCDLCQQQCQQASARQCPRCSATLGPHADTSSGCVHCRDQRFAFESVCSLGPYREALRSACLRAKTSAGQTAATGLAQQLWSIHHAKIKEWNIDVVIPVPHHWWEEIQRSHVCPNTLAESLAGNLSRPVRFDLLRKTRLTPKQALLPVTKRRTNLKGAFQIAGRATLAGARVLLVDDILTTGTTAHECSKVLLQAGAAKVFVGVFTRVATT